MQSFQEEDYTKRFDLSLWKKIIRLAKPYHKNLLLTMMYMGICAVMDVVWPRMTGIAMDTFIADGTTDGLVWFALGCLAITAVQVLAIYKFQIHSGKVETGTCYTIRQRGSASSRSCPFPTMTACRWATSCPA